MYEGQMRMGETRPMERLRQSMLSEELSLDTLGVQLPEIENVPEEEIPKCHILGVPCYYDGSGLAAEKVFRILCDEGSDGVWKYLEEYYMNVFSTDLD